MIRYLLVHLLVSAVLLLAVDYFVEGISITGFGHALLAAAALGAVNFIVRPIFVLVTLPITVVTLGLFLFVINALMLELAAAVVPGFRITGFGAALLGAALLAFFNLAASVMLSPRRRD